MGALRRRGKTVAVAAAALAAGVSLSACGSGGDSADAAEGTASTTTTAVTSSATGGTDYSAASNNLRKAFASAGVTMSDADLALTVPAAQTTCDTITNAPDAAKAYQAAVLLAQMKFDTEEKAGWFVDQSIYAFCPSMSPLAQAPQAW